MRVVRAVPRSTKVFVQVRRRRRKNGRTKPYDKRSCPTRREEKAASSRSTKGNTTTRSERRALVPIDSASMHGTRACRHEIVPCSCLDKESSTLCWARQANELGSLGAYFAASPRLHWHCLRYWLNPRLAGGMETTAGHLRRTSGTDSTGAHGCISWGVVPHSRLTSLRSTCARECPE